MPIKWMIWISDIVIPLKLAIPAQVVESLCDSMQQLGYNPQTMNNKYSGLFVVMWSVVYK